MNICWLDWETYNEKDDLRKCGGYRYAEGCEILLGAYAWGDEEIFVHDFTENAEFPSDLAMMIEECDAIGAHNGMLFDRPVAERSRYAWRFEGKRWLDTMVRAYSHSLPGGLGLLSDIYKLGEHDAKDKRGKQLVQLFCKPMPKNSKLRRATRFTHPKEWAEFKQYAKTDIAAMRVLHKKMPKWNETPFEREMQEVDRIINDRGFAVDLDFCQKAEKILDGEKDIRDARVNDATGGAVGAATQRDALLKYLCEVCDVSLPDLKKSTLDRRLEDPDIPEPVKELMRLRLQSAGTNTKKFQSIRAVACADGKVRGTQQFRGAHRTGRWGGRLIQPHNMMRPEYPWTTIAAAINLVKADRLDVIHEGPAVTLLSSCIRSVIVCSDGDFGIADLSSIEGRGLAYLANEEWKLDAYRDYDLGIGHDMYVRTYSSIFGVDPNDVDADMRQLGKVLELALGYEGGVGAFITFALTYGINLDELAAKMMGKLPEWAVDKAEWWWEESVKKKKTYKLPHDTFVTLDAIKSLWRSTNPAIQQFWRDLRDGMINVILGHKKTAYAGRLSIDMSGSWMRIRLPSGRYLSYPGAQVNGTQVSYLGVNNYTRKWTCLYIYGGKAAENGTQGFAADVFGHGLVLAERRGLRPVLGVHDEGIAEGDYEKLIECMTTVAEWAPGLPLAADGFNSPRYRKKK